MSLPVTARAAIVGAARRSFVEGIELAAQTRARVARTNQRMFLTLVLIDNAKRQIRRRAAAGALAATVSR